MQNLPQFLSENGQPAMSTSEYWTRFTFVLLMGSKNIQIEDLLSNTEELSEAEKLHMKSAKATFLTVVGEKTLEILKNPKEKVLEKDLKWIKTQWEQIWNESANQNHHLVKILKAKREKSELVFKLWNKLTKLATDCKLDTKAQPKFSVP